MTDGSKVLGSFNGDRELFCKDDTHRGVVIQLWMIIL